jgi:PPOX class probable F420-dependent enzyme
MSIRLDDDAAWALIEASHTGILTSTRRDGWPIALPIWFAVIERQIYVRTPEASAKVARIRRDPRCGFLVESGVAWAELRAASLDVTASIVEDEAERNRAVEAIERRYIGSRPDPTSLPAATNRHYSERLIIRLEPTGRSVSWDNSRIRLRAPASPDG